MKRFSVRYLPTILLHYTFLLLFVLFILLPLTVVVFSSFRPATSIALNPMIFPEDATFETLRKVWETGRMGRYAINSIIVIIPRVFFVLAFSSMAGYAFAKLKFIGKNGLYMYMLIGLIIPFQAVMIPLYYSLQRLGVANSYMGLVFPAVGLCVPFAILYMRAFYTDLPDDLIEASKIDGCGAYGSFFHIMLPLSKGGITSLVVFQFLWGWNEFQLPLLLITDENMRTLPLAITFFTGKFSSQPPLIAACVTLTSLPIIFVFILFQRTFTEGITSGAIKG